MSYTEKHNSTVQTEVGPMLIDDSKTLTDSIKKEYEDLEESEIFK